ncbi:hypothetical protein DICPUDRAFT_77196 [Dictyostelium purpureum]|uniref:Uncharacterized protein n=1 Tax=Dictyostelium purpureum TaxID=5786 RepID=F0ZFW5_DICPU|nr:uncharacterized protein DICPUDRAFT_77196 [Dictyostelium purpureum]EGC37185.1 hypothetical protein DICPUDRAFT_77196 [Dictyostelium purpureum]|eukprot:XP_003286313.1 hypothetical protein DICPUDRAFT_77196 [Dictyostelium purpureum]
MGYGIVAFVLFVVSLIPNPNKSQPSTITNSSEKVVIIESYPMVPRIWENLNYSGYLKFRPYIANMKYISIYLLYLVVSFLPYYSINYFDFYNDQLNSISPIQNNLQPLDGFISLYDQLMKD